MARSNNKLAKLPDAPIAAVLEVVVMPNGEVICCGQTLAWLNANADVFKSVRTSCATCGASPARIESSRGSHGVRREVPPGWYARNNSRGVAHYTADVAGLSKCRGQSITRDGWSVADGDRAKRCTRCVEALNATRSK